MSLIEQPNMPALEDLEAFVRVAETGSFTAAATRMHLPKSTISRRVSRLEAALETSLVVRTSRKVTLSEAGAAYLERIAPAIARIEEASAAAREERERPRGHLRVTAPGDLSIGWMPRLVTEFRARHPDVTVELLVDDRRVDLVAEGIDLAVRAAQQLEDSSLVARRLSSVGLGLWASTKYLDQRGRPARVEDLAQHEFALPRMMQARGRLTLTGPEGERTIDVRAPIGANDMAFLERVAVEDGGIAVLPTIVKLDRTTLEHVLPEYSAGASNLYCVYPSGRVVPAKVRAFRDFLVERAPQFEERCQEGGCPRSA
ncbi:LysR family transcriptional regulator [Sandaracinus amylolyticus]|nr:LysR family transcriptional regulator [Sandaracinus amylolyticus]